MHGPGPGSCVVNDVSFFARWSGKWKTKNKTETKFSFVGTLIHSDSNCRMHMDTVDVNYM